MPTQVRRVVIANDPSGKSAATSDETLAAEAVSAGIDIGGCELCSGVVTGLALLRTRTDARLPR